MKILLILMFFCTACLPTSLPKKKNAAAKADKETVRIPDTMSPLHPFIF